MLRKITLTLFALALLLPASAVCDTRVELMSPIQIEDLTKGVHITKRTRLIVEDIRIGETSVRELFSNSDTNVVSDEDYLSRKEETITLKLKDRRFLSRLNYLILTNEPSYLIVKLVDPNKGSPVSSVVRWFRKWVYFFLGDGSSRQLKYPIDINLPPCERVTQIIFQGIDSIIQDEFTKVGQTETSITLDQLFELLQKDQLGQFMEKLGPIDPTCPAIRMLKWIRNEEAQGFAFKEYTVTPELGSVLGSISKSVTSFQNWQRYAFRLSIVGYTDPVPVQDKRRSRFYLDPARTGVKSLGSKSRLDIYYAGCIGDNLSEGVPRYVEFFSKIGRKVRSPIESNCELGAVRAYSAAAFMRERLGEENVTYEYATGGIATTGDLDEEKRRVDLKISVKAATNSVSQ